MDRNHAPLPGRPVAHWFAAFLAAVLAFGAGACDEGEKTMASKTKTVSAPSKTKNGGPPAAANGGASKIHSSVYDFLSSVAAEKDGYGLYTYVLLPTPSARGQALLGRIFATTGSAATSLIAPKHLNLIYLPIKASARAALAAAGQAPAADVFARDVYNYPLAVRLLATICGKPTAGLKTLCETDLSRGPYVFTYAKAASALAEVPPPLLVLDLSDVHENAFGEFVAAYKAQVKRADYTDRERIDTFRLELLKISLKAADWVAPVTKAVKDILHGADS